MSHARCLAVIGGVRSLLLSKPGASLLTKGPQAACMNENVVAKRVTLSTKRLEVRDGHCWLGRHLTVGDEGIEAFVIDPLLVTHCLTEIYCKDVRKMYNV